MTTSENGFALVFVLWLAALMAMMIVAAQSLAHRQMEAVSALEDEARAMALADAAARQTMYELLEYDSGLNQDLQVDCSEASLVLLGGDAKVSVCDQGGLINLNKAPEAVLMGMFLSLGLDPIQAETLVGRIIDWRNDSDNGGNFQSVAELKLVLGMEPQLYQRVEPLLTVWGQRPDVDTNVSPRAVLLAIMDAGSADAVINIRPQPLHISARRIFGIHAVARAGSSVFVRDAIVHLTLSPAHPIQVFDWRQGEHP